MADTNDLIARLVSQSVLCEIDGHHGVARLLEEAAQALRLQPGQPLPGTTASVASVMISTRYSANTFHAKADGLSATSTTGHQAAAAAVARKLWPGQQFSLSLRDQQPLRQREVWSAVLESRDE